MAPLTDTKDTHFLLLVTSEDNQRNNLCPVLENVVGPRYITQPYFDVEYPAKFYYLRYLFLYWSKEIFIIFDMYVWQEIAVILL